LPPEEPQLPPSIATSPTAIVEAAALAEIRISRRVILFSLALIDVRCPLF
jgi:hypothetical protein